MKRVNFLCMIMLGVFFATCDTDDDPWGDWKKSNTYPGDERVLAVAFQYGNNVYVGLGYNRGIQTTNKNLDNFYKFNGTSWANVAGTFPAPDGGRQGCAAFVIGDIAYVGAGYRLGTSHDKLDYYHSDFYLFDLIKDEWMKDPASGEYLTTDIIRDSEPKIAGDDSVSAQFWCGIGFELKGKGYVGTGRVDGRTSKSMFSYDPGTGAPGTGKWKSVQTPGDPRAGAVVFKIDETAVIALGSSSSGTNKDVITFDGTEWKEKEPLVDLKGDWNNKYNEIPRSFAVAFTSDLDYANCGYIAGGDKNTVWRYTLKEDRWHQVEEFPRAMPTRVGAVGFSIEGIGYITTGGSSTTAANQNTTWEFIPGIDEYDGNDY